MMGQNFFVVSWNCDASHCYAIGPYEVNFAEARTFCYAMGAESFLPQNLAEQNFVTASMKGGEYFWFYAQLNAGNWVDGDGTKISFSG